MKGSNDSLLSIVFLHSKCRVELNDSFLYCSCDALQNCEHVDDPVDLNDTLSNIFAAIYHRFSAPFNQTN